MGSAALVAAVAALISRSVKKKNKKALFEFGPSGSAEHGYPHRDAVHARTICYGTVSKAVLGETSERRGGASMGFLEH